MNENLLTFLIGLGAGTYCLCGAAFQWDWFMNDRKVLFLQKFLGRTGVRVFYGILGLLLLGLGAFILMGGTTISLR